MASPVPKPRGGTEMRSQAPKCRPCQGMTPAQAPGPSAKWPENFRHRRWQSVVPEQLRHRHCSALRGALAGEHVLLLLGSLASPHGTDPPGG